LVRTAKFARRRSALQSPEARRGAKAGDPAFEAEGQVAPALDREADPASGRVEPHLRIGDVDPLVGQPERAAGGRRQQLVDFAQPEFAAFDAAAQAHSARDDVADPRLSPSERDFDIDGAGGEIGVARVADHQILEPLFLETDPGDAVGRLDAAPVELALDHIGCDLQARHPDDGDDQHQQQGKAGDHQRPARPTQRHPEAPPLPLGHLVRGRAGLVHAVSGTSAGSAANTRTHRTSTDTADGRSAPVMKCGGPKLVCL
jgi:hypothetical protein